MYPYIDWEMVWMRMYGELIPHCVQWEQVWITCQFVALIQAHSLRMDTHSTVCDVLQAVDLPYTQFAEHSFRIGSAPPAARAEIEDSVICTLDVSYICTPRDQLAEFFKLLI